jgi:hypothetical protein
MQSESIFVSLKPKLFACMATALPLLVTSSACSLIFTKGPQPEVHPPPECTTSVDAPVMDTVLATASLTLLGLGVAEAATSCPAGPHVGGDYCGLPQAAGWLGIAVGTALGALFISSAVVGYQRTSACRASLEPNAMLPQPKPSLLPATPFDACVAVSDEPRVCPRVALLPAGL